MNKKTICILYGGRSEEHEISLKSAASVVTNLDKDKYRIVVVGIDKYGRWYLQSNYKTEGISKRDKILPIKERDLPVSVLPGSGLLVKNKKLKLDVVFPILHGTFGEDGTVQGLLEIAGLPYVGSGVLASSLSMHKGKTKELWKQAGLPTADFTVISTLDIQSGDSSKIENTVKTLGLPLFVKPCCAGSSVGISKVKQAEGIIAALKIAFEFDNEIIIERAVAGREIECSVIGNDRPIAYPPGEIRPKHEFYDYEAKYTDPEGAELIIPAPLDDKKKQKVMDLAVKAYRAVGASGFSRVDFFIEETSGNIFLNEINTIPGFTSISMFPKLCEAAGISYSRILDMLIAFALERHRKQENLLFDFSL
ncbi:MAG: D-alanine--D-alanine ligase [Spirochaetales bacterium]|nr:D-alanine--D-alanine ligase [Spirochaetales bacterium]